MTLGYFGGTFQIAALFLAFVAGFHAISLFEHSRKNKHLRPWVFLIIALVTFAVVELIGAMVNFEIIQPNFLTHLLTSITLLFVMYAVIIQIKQNTTARGSK